MRPLGALQARELGESPCPPLTLGCCIYSRGRGLGGARPHRGVLDSPLSCHLTLTDPQTRSPENGTLSTAAETSGGNT